jgi:glycosyltransferase involved in cell wall biosynthesis
LPLILQHQPDATLDIVGDGVARPALERLAEHLAVADRVTFHGNVSHDGVLRLLQEADLFCYPTRASEGFPKVVLEAMACGIPVITTRVSVLPSLLGMGAGYLLDSGSATALSDAVRNCLTDRDRYRAMSEQAVETARQYSLEQWRNRIGDSLRAAWGPLRTHA